MVIGIYDSGLGGLSVWRELQRVINRPLVYFGDTAHVPYGEKTPAQLMSYFQASLAFLESKGCQGIVVACNTTSAVVLPRVMNNLRLPVVGMIESAVGAVSKVSKGRVGVLATRATTESGVYQEALAQALPYSEVFVQDAPKLVPLVEKGNVGGKLAKEVVLEYLEPLLAKKIDTLLLGCTHYSFLLELIKEVTEKHIRIVDPAPAVALKTRELLSQNWISDSNDNRTEFWVSASPKEFQDIAQLVLGEKLPAVNLHPWSGETM